MIFFVFHWILDYHVSTFHEKKLILVVQTHFLFLLKWWLASYFGVWNCFESVNLPNYDEIPNEMFVYKLRGVKNILVYTAHFKLMYIEEVKGCLLSGELSQCQHSMMFTYLLLYYYYFFTATDGLLMPATFVKECETNLTISVS